MNIIVFSTADWDAKYKTNKQHVSMEFAKRGHTILYVESLGLRRPHLTAKTDLLRIFRRLFRCYPFAREVDEGVFACSPLQIPFLRRTKIINSLNWALQKLFVIGAQRRLGFSHFLLWSYHPYVHSSLISNAFYTVYHCVDDLSTVPGINADEFKKQEAWFAEQGDIIFVTATNLVDAFSYSTTDVEYLPNVVDFEHFSKAYAIRDKRKRAPGERAKIGFHGALSQFKLNFDLWFDLITLCPEWDFIIVGDQIEGQSDSKLDKIEALPNVRMLGYQTYDELPAYMAEIDVAFLPFKINTYTDSMSPMKFLEYIAAGVPVVTTSAKFAGDTKVPIAIGDDTKTLQQKIISQLEGGHIPLAQAQKHIGDDTWSRRTDKMLQLCQISENF